MGKSRPVAKPVMQKPKYVTDVPRPDEDSVMAVLYGGRGVSAHADTPQPRSDLDVRRVESDGRTASEISTTVLLSMLRIDPDPQQPRKTFDESKLEELAASIASDGLMQPIAVRPTGDRYTIIAGERRFRAHQRLGRTEIEGKILEVTASQSFRLALIENVQRDSLQPLEEAAAYQRLLDDQNLTQAELARQLGLDRRRVNEKVALLRLPEAVRAFLSAHADNFGERHAFLLASAPGGVDVVAIAQRCAEEGWSLARLRSALEKREADASPSVFRNLHLLFNRRGGFTLTVRARSRDEITGTIAELERTISALRSSFDASARADTPELTATAAQQREEDQ